MNLAIQKTLSLILLIGIGLLLKSKLGSREQLGGIKLLILSIALPATIFVALLKIEIEPALLFLPLLALGFNLLMLLAAYYLLPLFGVSRDSSRFRTYWLLIPSLAPGLSCFPFVMEYLGEESLARAALADVGNKVFVLIIGYLLAMHLYYGLLRQENGASGPSAKGRLKGLLLSMLREPVNLVIVVALIMLAFGWNLLSLPVFLQNTFLRMSALMTPMVLLFIGMAVRFDRRQFRQIFALLLCRSGLAFCLSALLIVVTPIGAPAAVLLAVIFPQSAASFWPFAHMSAVASMEETPTGAFNLELALNILALSLPFSTIIILTICSAGVFFTNPMALTGIGLTMLVLSIGPVLLRRLRTSPAEEAETAEPAAYATVE